MNNEQERFVNVMADLISKYIDEIDLDSLPDPPKPERKSSGFLCFFGLMGKCPPKSFPLTFPRNISRFLGIKGCTTRDMRVKI